MKPLHFFIVAAMIISCLSPAGAVGASGPKPSELVKVQPLPGLFPISGATHDSMFAVEAWLEPIGPYKPWEVPNFGKMASYKLYQVQGEKETISQTLLNFSNEPIKPLESVNLG